MHKPFLVQDLRRCTCWAANLVSPAQPAISVAGSDGQLCAPFPLPFQANNRPDFWPICSAAAARSDLREEDEDGQRRPYSSGAYRKSRRRMRCFRGAREEMQMFAAAHRAVAWTMSR